ACGKLSSLWVKRPGGTIGRESHSATKSKNLQNRCDLLHSLYWQVVSPCSTAFSLVDVSRETFARIAGRLQAGMPGLFVHARG
ncbi:MAG: hypothetical protein E6236_10125, partial [Eggerthella sp.]|uniref:hypothetical protein n=1 Tax=Eggerthella sp. TaxID=1929886 RepID=UPI002911713B